jgi:hypothetical protein
MRIIKQRCPIYNSIIKQIEYREFEFIVQEDKIYNFGTGSTAINSREY